jgi:hypothetical protein
MERRLGFDFVGEQPRVGGYATEMRWGGVKGLRGGVLVTPDEMGHPWSLVS